jgi:hypothetical protein
VTLCSAGVSIPGWGDAISSQTRKIHLRTSSTGSPHFPGSSPILFKEIVSQNLVIQGACTVESQREGKTWWHTEICHHLCDTIVSWYCRYGTFCGSGTGILE